MNEFVHEDGGLVGANDEGYQDYDSNSCNDGNGNGDCNVNVRPSTKNGASKFFS